MKVLVIGSGGREHAICRAFSRSAKVSKIYCASGNAGIARIAECMPIKPDEIEQLADFAVRNRIDLAFAGGETPLALGIVDRFEAIGIPIIGPNRAATRLESSKTFAKEFMSRHGIPTAKFVSCSSAKEAVEILNEGAFGNTDTPVVVKADGLAAGKGVVVAADRAAASAAINDMATLVGETAASRIVLEEFLLGNEISLLLFVNGDRFALMPPTRDHKRIGDGDTGPNTGGMGAITDDSLLTSSEIDGIVKTVVVPTLKGCVEEGIAYRGILFLGLMMTSDGPQVLEYNVRFGDPETQAILIRLESDIIDVCEALLDDRSEVLSEIPLVWREGSSACVIIAAANYPSAPRTGDVITGLERACEVPGVEVFHSGTSKGNNDDICTAGGRVLGVTAIGDSLSEALDRAYTAVAEIGFDGLQYRRDIGRT